MDMTFAFMRRPRRASPGRITGRAMATVSCLMVLAAGCGSGQPASPSPRPTSPRQSSPAAPSSRTRTLAASYLAIAKPANHSLDTEVNGFTRNERSNLIAAEADLRAQAVTERWFDRRLLQLSFPAPIEAIVRALIRVNQSRAALADRQARSASVAQLRSFASRHKAADAAVEVQVRIIRADLGLPPPSTS